MAAPEVGAIAPTVEAAPVAETPAPTRVVPPEAEAPAPTLEAAPVAALPAETPAPPAPEKE